MSEEILETTTETQPMPSVPGKQLAAAREEKGLSIADVARSLRLSVRQIEAIEADDFDKLPSKTFLRGFIRNYAKLLQLDPEPLLLASQLAVTQPLPQAISVPLGQLEFSVSRSQRTFSGSRTRPWLKYLPAAVLVVGVLGWATFELLHGNDSTVVVKPAGDSAAMVLPLPPIPSSAQNEATPAGAAESAVVPAIPASKEENLSAAAPVANPEAIAAQSGGAKIKLSFSGESWIELKDKSGRTIYKQTGQAGNEQIISGTSPLTLTVGRAANVKVIFNDKLIDLAPYTSGDVARLTLN